MQGIFNSFVKRFVTVSDLWSGVVCVSNCQYENIVIRKDSTLVNKPSTVAASTLDPTEKNYL